MRFQLIPDKQGQICRLTGSGKEDGDNIYIFVGTSENDSSAEFVKLNDLQRNVTTPESTAKHKMCVDDFTVIAESLEKYISSWNSEPPPENLKAYVISEIDDVKQFFNDLHQILNVEFYPDDDFGLLTDDDDFCIFTDAQAVYLNQVMIDCFNVCDKFDADIYDLAGEVQISIWKARGDWPE